MTFTHKVSIAIVALAGAFAAGRYTSAQSTTTTAENTRERDSSQTHNTTTTTVTETPDGKKTTVIVADTTTKAESDKKTKSTSKEVIAPERRKTNVSALVAYDFSNRGAPQYGVSYTTELIGPITVGAFALQGGMTGLSLGVNF